MTRCLSDTDSESDGVQVSLLRGATTERRVRLALALSADVVSLARAGIRRRSPGISNTDTGLRFVRIHYGAGLAAAVGARLKGGRPS